MHKFDKKITSKIHEISKIKEFGTKFDIILAYTSRDELAQPAKDAISEMLIDLNGDDEDEDSCFSFHLLSRKKMTESLTTSIGKRNIDIEFLLTDYGLMTEPYVAYYGKITGSKLFEWWNDYSDGLFRDNIRNSLGSTPVNTIIGKTILEKPEHFWFFNNGITIICDEIKKTAENGNKRDFGFFKAVNASIVNGAQTYSTIGKNAKKGINIDNILVALRVIQTGKNNDSLKNDITKFNNTQNSILPKDFISQDTVQTNLQAQLSLSDYRYIIKRDEKPVDGDKVINIDSAIEALVMISLKPNFAALYKKEIGKFHNIENTQYKTLFNESTSPYLIINSFELNKKLEIIIKKNGEAIKSKRHDLKVDNIAESGNLLIKQLCYKSLSLNTKESLSLRLIDLNIDDNIVEEKLTKVIEYLNEYYKSNYIVTLFQNSEKCTEIFEKC